MTREEIFNGAKDVYMAAVDNLKLVTDNAKEVLADNFSAEAFVTHFDILLQAYLFKIAVADKLTDPYEIQFIEKIVEHGDILNETELTWEDIIQLQKKDAATFEKAIDGILGGFEKLLFPVAILELTTEDEVFKEIIAKPLLSIGTALAQIGYDTISKEEQRSAKKVFDKCVFDPYISMLKKISKKLG